MQNIITNAMSVDVEDYFQVSAFEKHIDKRDWASLPQRVAQNTQRILDLFAQHNVKATFFTLGWVAERNPALIRRIVDAGHELASHGYEHIRVSEQSAEQFRQDLRKTQHILQDISGQQITGYRAASYSIGAKNLWALDVLEEEGFQYSSSIYPIKHDLYGIPDAPRFKFKPTAQQKLVEIPVTTFRLGEKNIPCGGGGFFRLYPYALSKAAFKYINAREQQPGLFYFHPWEIDPQQPKQTALGLKTRFRHSLNLERMEGRLNHLLRDFKWDTMQAVFIDQAAGVDQ